MDEKGKQPEVLVKKFQGQDNSPLQFFTMNTALIFITVILVGLASGFVAAFASSQTSGGTIKGTQLIVDGKSVEIKKGAIIGSDDLETYKDSAEGILRPGGIDGEGAYHLERPGGESQYVYLTSSIVDLAPLENKKIKVWGATFEAEKAGWLMDVGRVEILE